MLSLITRYRALNFALLDQALVSGVNFLTIVILARRLGVEDFGSFMLAWLLLLFLKSLQGGIVISPMMSIGPKQAPADIGDYYGAALLYQILLAAAGGALILAGCQVFSVLRPDWSIGHLALPVAAAGIGDQVQEFARRYLFARDRAARAFVSDLATYGSRAALLLFVPGDDIAPAFWFVATSSAFGAALATTALADLRPSRSSAVRHWPRQWRYARWTAGAALMEWGSGHLIVIAAGGILGPVAVGAIRATTNVFAVVQALIQALNNVVPMRAASMFESGGRSALARYILRVTTGAGLACLAALALGTAFPSAILELLYGPAYADYAYLVYWWVIIYAAGFFQFPLGAALCAVEHTNPFFISLCCEAAFGIVCAYLLPRWLGLDGVMLGILVTRALPVLVLGAALHAWWRRGTDIGAAGPVAARRQGA